MKKILYLALFSFIIAFFYLNLYQNKSFLKKKDNEQFFLRSSTSPTFSPTPTILMEKIRNKKSLAIFLVDWMIDNQSEIDLTRYCPIIFFGRQEKFRKEQFQTGNCQDFFYTVKITDEDFVIRNDFFDEIKNEGFNGIVVDLEIAGIASDNLIKKISNLVEGLSKQAKERNLKFLIAVYGDTFHRHRPYDIDFLSKQVDGIMIMAYDFFKSYGEPGPNFPFNGKQKYGYDFITMVNDFLRFVPAEKLTVIFGMYGYDWTVDEKKRPISQAKALTLAEIKKKFLNDDNIRGKEFECQLKNCIIRRDPLAKEVEINYTIASDNPDEEGIYRIDYHIVWYEDEESVATKMKFLEEKGIGSVAYWAYKYF